MDPNAVLEFARDNEVAFVDVKFLDFAGGWQHFALPVREVDAAVFDRGLGFDGSAVRGWQPSHGCDMLVVPDPATARIDPFPKARTLSLIGDILDPLTREPCSRDPRHIARQAEDYLHRSGIAERACFAPATEFFLFDDVRFDQTRNSAFYFVDSDEGRWNTGRDEQPNLAYKPRYTEGCFPVPPTDSLVDLRQEMVATLLSLDIPVHGERHEGATGGQGEIELHPAPLLQQADNLQWFKYVLKNLARRNGKTLTFMPQPLFEENGSGMHTQQSLWKGDANLFAGDEYAGLSRLALWYVGGILRHAPALCAFCNPTTNSYRRLVAGGTGPVQLAYSSRRRSAAVRVPRVAGEPGARSIEYRTPDPSCSGHLAFAAMLMAGLDGIENQIDPGSPWEGGEAAGAPGAAPTTPQSLEQALDALEADQEFLRRGEVFSADALEAWLAHKRTAEVDSLRRRPTPWEFALYFDC